MIAGSLAILLFTSAGWRFAKDDSGEGIARLVSGLLCFGLCLLVTVLVYGPGRVEISERSYGLQLSEGEVYDLLYAVRVKNGRVLLVCSESTGDFWTLRVEGLPPPTHFILSDDIPIGASPIPGPAQCPSGWLTPPGAPESTD